MFRCVLPSVDYTRSCSSYCRRSARRPASYARLPPLSPLSSAAHCRARYPHLPPRSPLSLLPPLSLLSLISLLSPINLPPLSLLSPLSLPCLRPHFPHCPHYIIRDQLELVSCIISSYLTVGDCVVNSISILFLYLYSHCQAGTKVDVHYL